MSVRWVTCHCPAYRPWQRQNEKPPLSRLAALPSRTWGAVCCEPSPAAAAASRWWPSCVPCKGVTTMLIGQDTNSLLGQDVTMTSIGQNAVTTFIWQRCNNHTYWVRWNTHTQWAKCNNYTHWTECNNHIHLARYNNHGHWTISFTDLIQAVPNMLTG